MLYTISHRLRAGIAWRYDFATARLIFKHNLAAMKNLLRWLPNLRRQASILSAPTRLPIFSQITLSLISLGFLWFLIGSLTGKKGLGSREQRLTFLAGLSGLIYVGLDLFWHFDVRFLQSRAVAVGYYFARHLMGGIAVGLLLSIGLPKAATAAKVLLTASVILLVAINVFVIVRHLASATLFFCLGNGLFIGVLIPSALVLWLYQPKTNNQSGNA
jgi:hypothetical protein